MARIPPSTDAVGPRVKDQRLRGGGASLGLWPLVFAFLLFLVPVTVFG